MLIPRRKRPPAPAAAQTLTLPAPVGGLNARDALAAMPQTDAVTLDNFFPSTTSVNLRSGSVKWSTGYASAVESLLAYRAATTSKLFAASGASFYDATSSGAVGAAVVTGLANARWQYVNISTPGGSFLYAVNGADYPRLYDGTNWKQVASVSAQTVLSQTNSGTTATVLTAAAHGLVTGNWIVMTGAVPAAYNGTFSVTVPAAPAAQTISSITRVGTTATLTTAAPHNLVTNNIITVSGALPAQYNGTYVVTVTGATTLTYVMASDPGASAAPVGSYVVVVNTFTYTMLSNPGASAAPVGTYTVVPTITGVDPRTFIVVTLYANRLFFVEKDSMRVWYLTANQISGAASSFDLGSLMSMGGSLQTMATWTVDNADGVQEYACFISTEGEVLMYAGTDPSSASNWVKAGHFYIGRPIGRRCVARWGSDMVVLTTDGFVPLSKALLTDRFQLQGAISDKISNLVNTDTRSYFNNFGWQAIFYPTGAKMLVNVPQVQNSQQYQYVMNTITGAWCRFTGWNANVFEILGNDLYFGSNVVSGSAYVSKCDVGYSDDGAYIFGEAKTAFQYFGYPGRQKHVSMVQPVFSITGNMTATLAIDMDFTDSYPAAQPAFSGTGGTLWNTALWNTFPWSPGVSTKTDWQGITGVGDSGALHMRIVNNMSTTSWQAVTYVFRLGGVL